MPRKPEKKQSSKKNKKTSPAKDESSKARDSFVEDLRKKGMLGDIKKKIDLIPTGSFSLNRIIGDGTLSDQPGGMPRGYIIELYGDESTGKTTVALHVAKKVVDMNQIVIYADFEKSLRTQFKYIENIGLNIMSPNFIHLVPDNFEDGARIIGESLIKLNPALIIIDSVAAMLPKATFDKNADEVTQIGLHAKLTGSFLNWINKKLEKKNCALLLLNQMRSNIKTSQYDPGPKKTTTGGNAPKFFSTIRIRLKATSSKEEVTDKNAITGLPEKKAVSQVVKAVVEKNKLDVPWKSAPIHIVFGQGIDNILSLIALGINKKIIKKSGAFLSWKDPNSDLEFSIQGKWNLRRHLEQHPEILEAMKPYLAPTKDEQEMDEMQQELESKGIKNLTEEEIEQLKEIRRIKGEAIDDLEGFSEEDLADLADLKSITKN